MKVRTVMTIVVLTTVWIILTETVSWGSIAVGAAVGLITSLFMSKFLPAKTLDNVDFKKLATFPFYLIGQIYLAGFHVIRVVLQGSEVSVITLDTKIEVEALRVILVDSITLTPGSVLLDLSNEKATLLWLKSKSEPGDIETAEKQLKAHLERRLLRAQKI